MYPTPSEPEIVVDTASVEPGRPPRPPWLALLERRRRPLAIAAVIGALLGGLVATLLPPRYRASARLVIVPADDPTAMRGSSAPDVATATVPMLLSVLQSERLADAVVKRLGLDAVWRLPPREAALRLMHKIQVDPERKTNVVSVSIEDQIPKRARDLVAAVTDEAAAIGTELWSARDREQRERLEAELVVVGQKLDDATVALQKFRERTHVVDLPTQIKASLEQAAALERVRIDKVLAVRFARGYGNGTAIEVQRSSREAAAVTRELEALRHDRSRPGPLLPLDALPALEAEEARLRRSLDNASTRYDLVALKVNQLATASVRPNGRAETIDPAVEPLRRAGPSRLMFAGGGAVFGALITAFLLIVSARRRRLQLD